MCDMDLAVQVGRGHDQKDSLLIHASHVSGVVCAYDTRSSAVSTCILHRSFKLPRPIHAGSKWFAKVRRANRIIRRICYLLLGTECGICKSMLQTHLNLL